MTRRKRIETTLTFVVGVLVVATAFAIIGTLWGAG